MYSQEAVLPISCKKTVDQLGAERPRRRFIGGGSSILKGARLTVTGKPALIRRPYGSGGIVRPYRCGSKMAISRCLWSRPRQPAISW